MANEKRLIDSNALLAEAEKAKIRFPHDRAIMFDLIKNAPTVDAVPVVHGRWVKNGWNDYSCSVCKCQLVGHGASGWNYCPNCGADMRERKTDD